MPQIECGIRAPRPPVLHASATPLPVPRPRWQRPVICRKRIGVLERTHRHVLQCRVLRLNGRTQWDRELIAPDTTLSLTGAEQIDDPGVIASQALVPATQALVAFKAVPMGVSVSR